MKSLYDFAVDVEGNGVNIDDAYQLGRVLQQCIDAINATYIKYNKNKTSTNEHLLTHDIEYNIEMMRTLLSLMQGLIEDHQADNASLVKLMIEQGKKDNKE